MTSNPAAAVRMLVIYSICVPLAALVGWMATDTIGYGTLGFFGMVALLICSPLIIRYHYPMLIFALGAPIWCFFLKGNPPIWEVATILSLGISIIDRTLNSDKRFLSIPVITYPLLFVLAVTYATAELTGGIGLKALGGGVGGGKKYLAIFIGVATYFALTSRVIPQKQRKLYVALFFLAGLPSFISDMFPFLPSPLNYINLLVPPSESVLNGDVAFGFTRLAGLSSTAGVLANFMLARYGLRGLLNSNHPLRALFFFGLMLLTLMGGFRTVLISYIGICTMLFFMEGLHRTPMSLMFVFALLIGGTLTIPFADKMPRTFQRAVSFLPFIKVDSQVLMDAEGSKQWRENIWRDTWPKVPQYLLLGKGYKLSEQDFEMMGNGVFANGVAAQMDQSQVALAISGDYHNGPLSTLMPFGIWGGIAFIWLSIATLYVIYRNYRYGEQELKTVNAFMLAMMIQKILGFYLIFGSYSDDIGFFAKMAGFSIALNWCVRGPKKQPHVVPRIKAMATPQAV